MQQELVEFHGTISKLLFQNEENGFSVFVLHVNKTTEITVRGYVPSIQVGLSVHITGAWINHPKFGKQLEATSCSTQTPKTIQGLKKYLGSGMIRGIGPVYAEKLVDYFGVSVLDIINETSERLHEVPGIGTKRIEQIVTAWKDQKEIATIMVFLQEKGISNTYATKIYKKYGNQSIQLLQENPYRLAHDIWGIGFKIADQIAQKCGMPSDSLERIKASVLFILSQHSNNGHLYIQIDELKKKILALLELQNHTTKTLITTSLHQLYQEEKIILISDENLHFLTLPSYYFSEKGVAEKIVALQNRKSHIVDLAPLYQTMRTINMQEKIELHEEQQKALMACFEHKIHIITGGPGTGKTTIIKQLLQILEKHEYTYQLAAPTGRATKRMSESTGKHALTLHRLLEFDFSTYRFLKNEDNALKLDFLIVDEASMIDIFLAHALLKAVPLTAHVIFIGDINQLPSVGAGNFLHDVIQSNRIACTRLVQIFRQAQDSLIILNAHKVNNGEFPHSDAGVSKDFFFIKETDPLRLVDIIPEVFKKYIARFHISPDDTMVLLPMHRGSAGTQTINQYMQSFLNPDGQKPSLNHGGTLFKVGDRVMQLKNNYDKKVFNGDIGTITTIDTSEKNIQVHYFEQAVTYDFTELDELVLAYAITIHKSQGSEYKAVIIPLFMQHFTLLQRNLIYTAITRAKKVCILIGESKAIAIGIKNNKGLDRITFLTKFLTSNLKCR